MNVLIIEDEIPAQMQLQRMLNKHFPEFNIMAMLDSVQAAGSYLKGNSPDIIFMDVELSDGKCFELFNRVEVNSPVIITTAYEDYALPAFRNKCIDYLLKPIGDDEFKASVERCLDFCTNRSNNGSGTQKTEVSGKYKQRFTIKIGTSIVAVEVDNIAYFYSQNKATYLVTFDRKKYMMDQSLDSLEGLLNPESFFKLSRGCITSYRAIGNISKHFNSRLKVSLVPDIITPVLISRARVPFLLKWIDK